MQKRETRRMLKPQLPENGTQGICKWSMHNKTQTTKL